MMTPQRSVTLTLWLQHQRALHVTDPSLVQLCELDDHAQEAEDILSRLEGDGYYVKSALPEGTDAD